MGSTKTLDLDFGTKEPLPEIVRCMDFLDTNWSMDWMQLTLQAFNEL